MSTQIQKSAANHPAASSRPVGAVEQIMMARKGLLVEVLPPNVSIDRFVRVISNAAIRNPDLNKAYPPSLFSEAALCAQDGLLPDDRDAFLSTFYNSREKRVEVKYIPMIQGVTKILLRSGEILTLGSNIVHENDEFDHYFEDGEERIFHRPTMKGDPGAMIGAYAFATLKNGGRFFQYMTAFEINAIRKISRQSSNERGPWVQHTGQMWKKTVFHRLARTLPLDSQSAAVLERDHALYDFDEPTAQDAAPVSAVGESIPSAADSLKALGAVSAAPTKEAVPETETIDVDIDDREIY